tara:strand:- start:8203 stop:8481 length:279 start_codon:yes stop_codon:yes gene_type:complete
MNFNKVQELVEGINYPHLLAVEDVIWTKYDETIYWQDYGGVFSAEMVEGSNVQEDMFIFNGDSSMGTWMTYIFHVSKEIPYEEFEEKYSEMM